MLREGHDWFKLPEGSLEHANLTISHPAFHHPGAPGGLRSFLSPSAPCCFSPPCLPRAAPPAQIALLLLHPANSSFKTPLRGQLQEAFPAPPRLGKMLPVCLHHGTYHVNCVTCSCVCVCVCVPLTVLPPGKDQILQFLPL